MIVTICVANAVEWTLSYFYHPYFEGLTLPPWGYVCLGLVLGVTIGIGQRMLLPSEVRHTRSWALASAIALPIATLLCGTVVERTLMGMNPLAAHPYRDTADLMRVLHQPKNWTQLAVQFAAMVASGLIAGAITARRAERRHAY